MRLALALSLIWIQVQAQQTISLCEDSLRTFTYYSNSNQDGHWIWTMGADTIGDANSVTITWDQTGTYDITVRFFNGCYMSPQSYRVYVLECVGQALYFANAFTPNGDGINDGWKPIGFGVSDIRWYIFDRWGIEIYQAHGVNDVWDGCYGPERREVQADVYVWLCNWQTLTGGMFSRTGRVTVVR